MNLFLSALRRERNKLDEQGVRIHFIGDRSAFSAALCEEMSEAERQTQNNMTLMLIIAANYGGRWDIEQAAHRYARTCLASGGLIAPEGSADSVLEPYFSTAGLRDPDLFIRTGGERRISNFLLWQMAYTELYFTDTLWPDFGEKELDAAITDFSRRQRRYGSTGDQPGSVNG